MGVKEVGDLKLNLEGIKKGVVKGLLFVRGRGRLRRKIEWMVIRNSRCKLRKVQGQVWL